jgi:RNA polymerase sigma-70 factor, ECF subfamily
MKNSAIQDLPNHLPVLRRYALVLTRNAEAADDLVQETMVKALEGARSWRGDGELRKWLLSIAHNAHVSRWRRERNESASASADDAEESAAVTSAVATPPDQNERIFLNQTLQAVMALPLEQREALVLVAIEGMSYRSAAEILDIPVGTLMSRLGRARDALRRTTGRDAEADRSGAAAPARPPLRLVR